MPLAAHAGSDDQPGVSLTTLTGSAVATPCAGSFSGAASARNGVTTSRLLCQQALREASLASRRAALRVAHQYRSRWMSQLRDGVMVQGAIGAKKNLTHA
jgi:hypothetical protein